MHSIQNKIIDIEGTPINNELPSATLIVWGKNDQISDPANGSLLHESVPGSKLVIFKGAKHPCYLEQPELWHETLLKFAQTVIV